MPAGSVDIAAVSASAAKKWLRLRRPDRCAICDHELRAGDHAIWDSPSKTVTCLGCDLGEAPAVEGQTGASALPEYERRRRRGARLVSCRVWVSDLLYRIVSDRAEHLVRERLASAHADTICNGRTPAFLRRAEDTDLDGPLQPEALGTL